MRGQRLRGQLMDGLSRDEKAIFTYLLISNIGQYFESLKKEPGVYENRLRYMLVLEEAHHFCPTCGHQTDQISACANCGTKQFMPVEQERLHCLACGAAVVQGQGNPIGPGWDQCPAPKSS